jgi:uncharacterized membrane protein YjjP (DUF1212 family)
MNWLRNPYNQALLMTVVSGLVAIGVAFLASNNVNVILALVILLILVRVITDGKNVEAFNQALVIALMNVLIAIIAGISANPNVLLGMVLTLLVPYLVK